MAKSFYRRLIERTVAITQLLKGFCSRYLRVALNSSPLWRAARAEDIYNLYRSEDKVLKV